MIATQSAPSWLKWVTLALFILSAGYFGIGFHDLVTDETLRGTLQHVIAVVKGDNSVTPETLWLHAHDVKFRHNEQSYIRIGVNPYEIQMHPEKADPVIGRFTSKKLGGYPPWAFLTQEVLMPPLSVAAVRWYMALVNALAYFVLGAWAYSVGKRTVSPDVGWFMVAICFACSGNATQLRWGNYSTIVMALLLFMNYFSRRNQQFLAGLFLGFAMLKPHNAMLFTFVLFARKQWIAVATAIGYTIIAGLITAWRVSTSPIEMMNQMFAGAMNWPDLHLGIFDVVRALDIMPTPILTKIGLLTGIAVAFALCWLYRSRSNEVLMAIAAVLSYVTTYHQRFDMVTFSFLMVPLAAAAFRQRSLPTWLAFLANAAFLWLPLTNDFYFTLPVLTAHCLVAIWGLIVLLRDPTAELADYDDRPVTTSVTAKAVATAI